MFYSRKLLKSLVITCSILVSSFGFSAIKVMNESKHAVILRTTASAYSDLKRGDTKRYLKYVFGGVSNKEKCKSSKTFEIKISLEDGSNLFINDLDIWK